jgi:hypothetical protein
MARSRGLGDVYKRQASSTQAAKKICLWIAKRRWPKKIIGATIRLV